MSEFRKSYVFKSGWLSIPFPEVWFVGLFLLSVLFSVAVFAGGTKPAQAQDLSEQRWYQEAMRDFERLSRPYTPPAPTYEQPRPPQTDGLKFLSDQLTRQHERYMDWQAQRQIEADKWSYRDNLKRCAPYNRACAQELYGMGVR